MMESIEGKLFIDLYPQKTGLTTVDIRSQRPLQASRILNGKPTHQALETLPLLFSVCGIAQARTAVKAVENCLGIAIDTRLDAARDMLVLVETAREHLFRILHDWPQLFNLPTPSQFLPPAGQLIPTFNQALFTQGKAFTLDTSLHVDTQQLKQHIDALETLLTQAIYGRPLQQWLTIADMDELYHWAGRQTGPAAQSMMLICDHGWASQGMAQQTALPELPAAAVMARLTQDADAFIATPDWQGQAFETGVFARQLDHPLIQAVTHEFENTLISRWSARLLELARIPTQLRQLATQLEQEASSTHPSGLGVAQTQAARGLLIHRVEIDSNVVQNYQIVAPTEWNFHPQGLVAHSLSHLTSSNREELEQLTRLMINAIDPCVGYDLEIH